VAQHNKGVMPATAMGLFKAETCKSQASKDDVSDGQSPALQLQLQLQALVWQQADLCMGKWKRYGMLDAMIKMQAACL
jgi:hypothetical protein